ncbi:protein spire 1-like protein [Leptotrombidium deliense]|uniref:Protein spire 1-like protein n=1 Tax=Leptotrombidium deliense TaxID=299467 RepID=A0A443SRS6_9ACAR|nr:protein spire 1-like protein [Leptotrombidium deliense]
MRISRIFPNEAILSTLGVTLFQALDYGISEEEERTLDSNLEILIEKLASSHPSQNVGECEEYRSSDDEKDLKDEGIERDSPDDESEHPLNFAEITIEKVIEELRKTSLFVVSEKLHDNSSNLDDLGVADWARLWMQVIRDLRRGVELKKVDLSGVDHRMEYELTPYEMLLDDIRLRRYKLNKVMVNGDIPQRMKKDAHALILEFIRSRPPLVPASKRLLRPPPPKQQTLYEKLMHSIRQQHKLKPTPPSSVKHSPIHLGRVMQADDKC